MAAQSRSEKNWGASLSETWWTGSNCASVMGNFDKYVMLCCMVVWCYLLSYVLVWWCSASLIRNNYLLWETIKVTLTLTTCYMNLIITYNNL